MSLPDSDDDFDFEEAMKNCNCSPARDRAPTCCRVRMCKAHMRGTFASVASPKLSTAGVPVFAVLPACVDGVFPRAAAA